MPLDTAGFDRSVPLPPELKIGHIREAIEHVEDKTAELIDIYFEQANVFSGIVGILGIQALHALSPYKKHKHPDVAQQRFPDLSLRGKLNPPPEQALESKGSTRPWALQSHYNHPGWYIVWRYAIDQTKRLKTGKVAAIWRVDVAFLRAEDWKYEGSKAAEGRGGRTHTFGIKNPAKHLRGSIVYQNPRVAIRQGGPVLASLDD
ncbi:MAG TPA: hypothetical protein VN948_03025 [Terriglobales bacterium]|nr:hypothetical protein [Terriglobales bacterium]